MSSRHQITFLSLCTFLASASSPHEQLPCSVGFILYVPIINSSPEPLCLCVCVIQVMGHFWFFSETSVLQPSLLLLAGPGSTQSTLPGLPSTSAWRPLSLLSWAPSVPRLSLAWFTSSYSTSFLRKGCAEGKLS